MRRVEPDTPQGRFEPPGVICIKDWTRPDPDPDIGFLAIDNTGQHRS